jgi:type IV secretory pathway VirJ component
MAGLVIAATVHLMKDFSAKDTPEFENIQSSELIHLGPLDPPQSSELTSFESTDPPTSTYTMSQAMENIERISLDLLVTDDSGNYFPPTIRSDKEKELLRELSSARSQVRALERQVLHAQVEAGIAKVDAAIARAREHTHPQGPISGLISALTFGIL